MSRVFRPAILAPLLCLIYALAVVATFDDPLALATIGARYAPDDLINRAYSDEGYDGQTIYYIARSGFDAAPHIDVPAYRYQRILLPALGGALSLGQSDALVWALLAVNLLAVGLGTLALEQLLADAHVSRWYAIGYALSLGIFGAARLLTTEPVAYAAVLLGILAMQRGRWLWAALAFALAALGKEPTLLFPFAYGLWLLYQRRIGRALIFGALVLLPFALWQMVLYAQFGALGIGSGGEGATGFEIIPFMGFIRILLVGGVQGFVLFGLIVGVFAVLPALWGLWQCGRDAQRRTWTLWTLLLAVNAAVMLFVPFSTYRELLGILRFIVGLQIAVMLYAAHKRQRRALRYSTLWFVTSALVIFSDFAMADAAP